MDCAGWDAVKPKVGTTQAGFFVFIKKMGRIDQLRPSYMRPTL
jgi:hypothetical protein